MNLFLAQLEWLRGVKSWNRQRDRVQNPTCQFFLFLIGKLTSGKMEFPFDMSLSVAMAPGDFGLEKSFISIL